MGEEALLWLVSTRHYGRSHWVDWMIIMCVAVRLIFRAVMWLKEYGTFLYGNSCSRDIRIKNDITRMKLIYL